MILSTKGNRYIWLAPWAKCDKTGTVENINIFACFLRRKQKSKIIVQYFYHLNHKCYYERWNRSLSWYPALISLMSCDASSLPAAWKKKAIKGRAAIRKATSWIVLRQKAKSDVWESFVVMRCCFLTCQNMPSMHSCVPDNWVRLFKNTTQSWQHSFKIQFLDIDLKAHICAMQSTAGEQERSSSSCPEDRDQDNTVNSNKTFLLWPKDS